MRLSHAQQRDLIAIVGSGLFDSAWYVASYPDVAGAAIDPLVHFVVFGWREGRDPGPLFSVTYYLEQGPDVAAAAVNPLVHYLEDGWREGRRPRPDFDSAGYLARHGIGASVCPLVHEAARRRAAELASPPRTAIDA